MQGRLRTNMVVMAALEMVHVHRIVKNNTLCIVSKPAIVIAEMEFPSPLVLELYLVHRTDFRTGNI